MKKLRNNLNAKDIKNLIVHLFGDLIEMSPAITKLLIELIAVPVAAELLKRRGIHGATKENLAAFVSDPESVVKALQSDKKLQTEVVDLLADSTDNIFLDAVEAISKLFATVTPGGVRSNDS